MLRRKKMLEVARFGCIRSVITFLRFALGCRACNLGKTFTESSGIHYNIIGISQIPSLGAIGAVVSVYKKTLVRPMAAVRTLLHS